MTTLLTKGWIQGSIAARENGDYVTPFDPAAQGFCLLGALFRAGKNLNGMKDAMPHALALLGRAMQRSPSYTALWFWNDDRRRTHNDVLALLAKAKTL